MPPTTVKTASKVSGSTAFPKGFTEYELDFSTQTPTHVVVGGEPADEDTERAVQTIQNSIQSRCTQPGVTFPQALASIVTPPSNIVLSGDFDATIKVWPPR
jgi:hypothetical protein